jgi:ferric-dicitrate binding protein FerR (iron transport regulator)/Mg-chelatase subunit ChlD
MRTAHDEVMDDLDALVAGDASAISQHAEHLASCDQCRDAKHEASKLAARIGDAGADYAPSGDLVAQLMSKLDDKPVEKKPAVAEKPVRDIKSAPSKRKLWLVAGAAAALAAGTVGVATLRSGDSSSESSVAGTGPIGKVKTISRAATEQGDGLAIKTDTGWRPLRADEMLPAGAEIRTDERTRSSLELADGSRLVLDHRTQLVFDPAEPRRIKLLAGRIAADVAHADKRQAQITTPNGRIDVVGTRFSVTAADKLTAVQVTRGTIVLNAANGSSDEVRAGEEGLIENGKLSVTAAPQLVKESAWSELEQPKAKQTDQETTAGIGALRAYKPGEKRDRDWKLALANHEVKVRITGPVARTEITETFRNDSDTTLEGVYQFPLPADAQIDSLSLDMENEPGGFITGAFVDKERAAKIWRGVIDKATPKKISRDPLIQQEIVWVPGPWKDPALLDWKRGGRFELRIFPIPAKGARTIKLSYTQVVTPRGPQRQYVYPLPHSADGSTIADSFKVDVEVRGAQQGTVRAAGYELKRDAARGDVNAMTLEQGGFVPRGDLVVDYRPDGDAEVRAWTFTGGAAAGPDDKLTAKKNVGIDPKVVDAQKLVAGDARPTAVLALSPKLPRWRESKARDYMIVVDGSQSMVGERFTRASDLAVALVADMDRRDRFGVMVCDSECRDFGDLRAPSTASAGELKTWLAAQTPAGASDVVAALRAGTTELKDAQREKWVLYVGDGFASTGFRRVADVEKAVASTTGVGDVHVTTIGIGSDADSALLAAAARGGGGSYLAWVPGQAVSTAAMAVLESTYGTSLRDATVELPAGMSEVAAAGGAPGETTTTTSLPTLRAGGEVLIAARINGDVSGDVILRGKVAGQKFEQRYPLTLAVSTAAGNGFVPRLWASLAIDQLERQGKGEDRARIVALSQGYGVMSRETSLLVLESQAMFDAFGVDRSSPAATWTGEEEVDEVASSGTLAVPADNAPMGKSAAPASVATKAERDESRLMMDLSADGPGGGGGGIIRGDTGASRSAPRPTLGGGRRMMIAMKRVWTRQAALGTFDGASPNITKAIADAQDALAKSPDSREKHRALVQALSYAGKLDEAHEVANRWLERDKLDPQALGYIADLLGRDGKRELALRTLGGLVDLDPDRANLHDRMINAYERTGRLAQACNHRIALVALSVKEAVKRAGAAARCLRSLGRTGDADLVMASLVDDKSRTEAEKLATVAAIEPRVAGDLVINGTWDGATDLDISLVAPDGTRVSWMGGRTDITVADSTARDREQLSIKRLKKGNYLIEINRGEHASSTVRGRLDISVLGQKKSLPFELHGARTVVGKINVTLHSHLEPVNPGDARWLRPGWQNGRLQ